MYGDQFENLYADLGLTQYKTSKKWSQNKQNVTESCLPKGQAEIQFCFLKPCHISIT